MSGISIHILVNIVSVPFEDIVSIPAVSGRARQHGTGTISFL